MKENNKLVLLAAIIVFGLYFLVLGNVSTIFEAEVVVNDVTTIDSLALPKSIDIAQSFFDAIKNDYSVPYLLQASVPLTGEDALVTFTTTIKNPLEENILITDLVVYQNEIPYSRQVIDLELQPGTSTFFKTKEIELEIIPDVLNNVKLEFYIESSTSQFTQTYEYDYYALSTCKSSYDCPEGKVCDVDNLARFSDGKEFYCVLVCGSNSDCPDEQVCINGRCGY